MSSEVAKLRRPQTQQPANVTDLPGVVGEIMGSLRESIAQMQPDDLHVELSAGTEPDNRTYARFSLRCYKKGEQVVSEERDI